MNEFCGVTMSVTDSEIAKAGGRIHITWKCISGHEGECESCPSVHGIVEKNLLTAAATLFTVVVYTDIAEWAQLLNLQLLGESTNYSIQSSNLIPVIKEVYNKQEHAIIARLIGQTLGGEGLRG